MNFRISVKHNDENHFQTIFLNNVEMVSSDIRKVLEEGDEEKKIFYERDLVLLSRNMIYKLSSVIEYKYK